MAPLYTVMNVMDSTIIAQSVCLELRKNAMIQQQGKNLSFMIYKKVFQYWRVVTGSGTL